MADKSVDPSSTITDDHAGLSVGCSSSAGNEVDQEEQRKNNKNDDSQSCITAKDNSSGLVEDEIRNGEFSFHVSGSQFESGVLVMLYMTLYMTSSGSCPGLDMTSSSTTRFLKLFENAESRGSILNNLIFSSVDSRQL